MAGNTAPIYSRIGDIQWGSLITTANTAKDGTGTVVTIFTADATNGGRVERIRIRAAGTNVATVLRVFVNNGSTNTTASNNSLLTEITVAATTLSEVAALTIVEIPNSVDGILPLVLPPGYKLNITIGTTISAGLYVTAIGGKY
jgi:hypothetical protein